MKKIFTIVLIAGVILIMAGGTVFAGNTYDPEIKGRIIKQQIRIDDGIASGELTRTEAVVLQDNLNEIKAKEAMLKADDRLTTRERVRLHRMLDRNNEIIFKKKHNPVRRLYP